MDQPVAADIRSWSPPLFGWDTYGFPAGTDGDTALDIRAAWAVGQLYAITGRTLASITTVEDTAVAQKVLAAFVMTEAMGGGQAALEVLDQPWLKSFQAGSYAETRFSPAELAGGGTQRQPPFPMSLWWLLWSLMGPEKRAEWMAWLTGKTAAAAAFIPMDFDCGYELGPMVGGGAFDSWPGW